VNFSEWETLGGLRNWDCGLRDDGPITVWMRLKNGAGLTADFSDEITLDTDPPEVYIASPVPQAVTTPSPVISLYMWDNLSGMKQSVTKILLDDVDKTAQAQITPWEMTLDLGALGIQLAEGTHRVYVEYGDNAGNVAGIEFEVLYWNAQPIVDAINARKLALGLYIYEFPLTMDSIRSEIEWLTGYFVNPETGEAWTLESLCQHVFGRPTWFPEGQTPPLAEQLELFCNGLDGEQWIGLQFRAIHGGKVRHAGAMRYCNFPEPPPDIDQGVAWTDVNNVAKGYASGEVLTISDEAVVQGLVQGAYWQNTQSPGTRPWDDWFVNWQQGCAFVDCSANDEMAFIEADTTGYVQGTLALNGAGFLLNEQGTEPGTNDPWLDGAKGTIGIYKAETDDGYENVQFSSTLCGIGSPIGTIETPAGRTWQDLSSPQIVTGLNSTGYTTFRFSVEGLSAWVAGVKLPTRGGEIRCKAALSMTESRLCSLAGPERGGREDGSGGFDETSKTPPTVEITECPEIMMIDNEYTLRARGTPPGGKYFWTVISQDACTFTSPNGTMLPTISLRAEKIAQATVIVTYTHHGESADADKEVTIVNLQFITKGKNGELFPQEFSFNCVPNPIIEASVDSCTIAADGTVSMSISGTFNDPASDLVDDLSKQIRSLDVVANRQVVQTINLTNEATPEYPWAPYQFASTFSTDISFPATEMGEYEVELCTPENVAGCAGRLPLAVSVRKKSEPITYTIVLTADPTTMIFYAGSERPGVENELLYETGPATGNFAGQLFWASVEVEPISFAGSTVEVDTLVARVKFTYSNGQYDECKLQFVETGAETSRFTAEAYEQIDGADLGGNLNLVLPAQFNETSADQVRTYMGSRDPGEEDFILAETAASNLIFNGDASWADTTVELTNFPGLTSSVDTINATWTFLFRDGTVEAYQLQMVETEAESNRFIYDFGVKNIYEVGAQRVGTTTPGTFMPSLIRIEAPPEADLAGKTSIFTFDRNWDIQRKNFGDGYYWYAADAQQNAVVFLPALRARSYIQTEPLEDEFDAKVVSGQVVKGEVKVIMTYGLRVDGGPVDLGELTNCDTQEYRFGTVPVFIYRPEKDKEVGYANQDVTTEIKWRYVGTKKTVVHFESQAEFTNDIAFRVNLVQNVVRSALFQFPDEVVTPEGTEEPGPESFNTNKWKLAPLLRETGWVRGDKAYEALADMFGDNGPELYAIYCRPAQVFACMQAIALIMGQEDFDRMILNAEFIMANGESRSISQDPFLFWITGLGRRELVLPNVDKNNAYVKLHENNAQWIPGDSGYIENTCPTRKKTHEGENVIYLGGRFINNKRTGCFETDVTKFFDGAIFWGQVGFINEKVPDPEERERTLTKWLNDVASWDGEQWVRIGQERYYLRQGVAGD
jgi:hypothetical protein